ncbi:leucyl aminopeptidase [uncultured Microbacterium sp.]|uniref:leucyl aminopeptidase n=1 Tax=uncultured Microbacterium sp. TaxID=191216 RepID=UPI0025CCC3C1|nr:leucyl aminopeptidase [uncultured Microbacterium sp.]
MSAPTLSVTSVPARDSDAEAVALLLPPDAVDTDSVDPVIAALSALGFTGRAGQTVRVPVARRERAVLVVGTGADPDASALRSAAGVATRLLTGVRSVAIEAPGADVAGGVAAILEGAALGAYVFRGYKSTEPAPRATEVAVTGAAADDAAERATILGSAVALVKDLTTMPADRLGPEDLAERSIEAVAGLPIEVEVLDETELERQGYGGILGVGRGSDRPPRLVRLTYAPTGATRTVAVVGKGITFDTGGLSLKPPASMVGMKDDMAGAATALAVVRAAAQLALPVAVTAYLCIADNMPSGRATRPGDVLTILGGTSVEVLNTDAEGRLVLADGLVAASREHPDLIIDVATLTGAITTALGTRHTGVMGDDAAVRAFLDAASTVGEPAWPLPLPEHMREELDSPIADLVNAKIGDPAGGALFAGLFLQHFVGTDADGTKIPWVHLDIAASGWHKGSPFGWTEKGATGAMTRAIVERIERLGDEEVAS